MKKLAIAAAVIVFALGGGLFYVYGHLGALIKDGVETYGPPITGTDVQLSSARLSIFSGQGALSGLRLGNPKGYSDNDAFELGKIELSIDPKSVTSGVVRVRSLVIEAPELLAEFDAAGRSNLDAILAHVRGASGSSGSGGSSGEGGDVRLIVDELRFEKAQLRVTAPAYKLDRTLTLQPIVLRNLGGKRGLTPAQLSAEVMKPVVSSAVQAAAAEYLKVKGGSFVDKLFGK